MPLNQSTIIFSFFFGLFFYLSQYYMIFYFFFYFLFFLLQYFLYSAHLTSQQTTPLLCFGANISKLYALYLCALLCAICKLVIEESTELPSSDDDDSKKSLHQRPKRFQVLPDLISSILNGVNKSRKPYLRLDVANYVTKNNNFGGEFYIYVIISLLSIWVYCSFISLCVKRILHFRFFLMYNGSKVEQHDFPNLKSHLAPGCLIWHLRKTMRIYSSVV